MEKQEIIFTNKVGEAIDKIVEQLAPSKVFVLVDANTQSFVLPRLQFESKAVGAAEVIMTKAGDINKNLESLTRIWQTLSERGATRNSLLINVGGGVVTDIGAFAAATFKRGMAFVNVPTSLLGAVDAAVGGKTGINLNNLKNQIGVFHPADYVVVSSTFFNTLTSQELLSGYAEMIKHSLLQSQASFDRSLRRSPEEIEPEAMLELLEESVLVKKEIVDKDPEENGARRMLNIGHTAGHAFETLAMERKTPIAHGYAIMFGMITELVISSRELGFPSKEVSRLAQFAKEYYEPFAFTCDDYPRLLEIMKSDKKNRNAEEINFTLLKAPGEAVTDCVVKPEAITEALDITRDLLAI